MTSLLLFQSTKVMGMLHLFAKVSRTDPDGVSHTRDTYNVHDINDWVIINKLQEFLHKHVNFKVRQDNNILSSI